jgi:hypothetical protein
MTLKHLTITDKVYLEGMTSLANGGGEYPITNIRDRFDEITGERYRQLEVEGEWYDSRTGECVSNPNFMYYIEPLNE